MDVSRHADIDMQDFASYSKTSAYSIAIQQIQLGEAEVGALMLFRAGYGNGVQLGQAAERERCAEIAENLPYRTGVGVAETIRAQGRPATHRNMGHNPWLD